MIDKAPSIIIISGEASGDVYGALLAARLKEKLPHASIKGIGSRRMRESGVELLYDSSSWSAIGITEALKLAPGLLIIFRRLRNYLKAHPPNVLVLIDFGAFNVRVGRSARPPGTKVLYYFPPGSWKRGATYSQLDGITDRIVTPFPWSADSLRNRGFEADFFGHPLLDVVKDRMSRDEFCEHTGLDSNRSIIGLLPGSRAQEIVHTLPVLLMTAARMLQSDTSLQFAIPLATSIDPDAAARELSRVPWVDAEVHRLDDGSVSDSRRSSSFSMTGSMKALAREAGFSPPSTPVRVKLVPGLASEVLAHSRAAVVTSGTATVEAMIHGCPMVIIYRGSRLSEFEYKIYCMLGKRIKFIGMPNIILDRMACPELTQHDALPEPISELMLKLISDSPERAKMLSDLSEARALLGNPGATEKTAQVVLDMLKT